MRISTVNELAKALIDRRPELELSGEALLAYRRLKGAFRIQVVLFLLFAACCFGQFRAETSARENPPPVIVTSEIPRRLLQAFPDSDPVKRAYLQRKREKGIRLFFSAGMLPCILGSASVCLLSCRVTGADKWRLVASGVWRYRSRENGDTLLLTRK